MIEPVTNILSALVMSLPASDAGASYPIAAPVTGIEWAGWILWLPAISTLLCGICAAIGVRGKAPAWITVALLGASFFVTLSLYLTMRDQAPATVHLFDWFDLHWGEGDSAGSFIAHCALYIDQLTLLWMLFVTGLGTLIALYASEYMEPDVGRGYSRFFAGVSVFLLAMSALVMGDNLVMLYLGWEGVGFASYWLIGYYYTRPSAVAAAKKAFIMNRIGDLGLALGIWLVYHFFGTVEYAQLFQQLQQGVDAETAAKGGWMIKALPFLFMLGAFGKSAQIPLYVWLPDAMEGPTPVSALIHAATMVTAGVYLLARMFPLMALHPAALPTVAWIGGLTALLAATIGMAQYDIKRIMAYSTVSQLGYMFAGIGFMTTFGAAYHVFTHAFFKAVLFLTCGAIMHGFAGQLDLRKISGLRHLSGWKITAWTMFIGCLCLAGFPITSGYFSKDAILAEAFVAHGWGFKILGWILLLTAGLTAYYTFRVWFRVCDGPLQYEMGSEHHGDHGDDAGHGHGHEAHGHRHGHHDHGKPHAPRLAINLVLVVLAAGAILAEVPYFLPNRVEGVHGGWVADMVAQSSARAGVPGLVHEAAHGTLFGADPHKAMYVVSAIIGIVGIGVAFILHRQNRRAADNLRARLLANPATRWLPTAMENKWYVDELYDTLIRAPLRVISYALYGFDRYVIDLGLVDNIGRIPRWLGRAFQPLQNGLLQSYALTMAGGVGLIIAFILLLPWIQRMIESLGGGAG
jgi:NADH-quinone oxidoreductase subunit L